MKKPPKVSLDRHDPSEDDDGDQYFYQAVRRGSSAMIPNTYFPISFGRTNGGAIAIANAFSNGKTGTVASRATAYGSRSKKRDD